MNYDASFDVYSRPQCSACRLTKKLLEKYNIAYTEYDVEEMTPEVREIVRSNSYSAAPLVIVRWDDEIVDHWSGFNENRIKSYRDYQNSPVAN